MADAVCEIADAARQAFVKAGFDPGEWDGDNIVQDVKRGLVDAVETLAARSATAHQERDSIIEECAKACDGLVTGLTFSNSDSGKRKCAEAIRALKSGTVDSSGAGT
jgi:hypothetical protein